MNSLQHLQARLKDVHNLHAVSSLLDWDQQTYMPRGGANARAEHSATVSRLAHEMLTDDATGQLLEHAEREHAEREYAEREYAERSHAEREYSNAFLRVARRNFDKATKLPGSLVEERARVTSIAQEEWMKARAANEYSIFAPHLERIVDLNRRTAAAYGYENCLYDALMDDYEEGLTVAQLDPIFEALKNASVPLIEEISQRPPIDASVLSRNYDKAAQLQFAERVLEDCGFDFQRGRQDTSAHPFCTNFGRDDVRITTRASGNDLQSALFGSLHEMGHALYEQNIAPELDGNILGGGVSLGVHESQSRLWENLVGRSRAFWNGRFSTLKAAFPQPLSDVDLDTFYRAINTVQPSLIRVEADEVTYNLHIILRYEMEVELLEGRLCVADAPAAWNARMKSYLGVDVPDDAHGILQDVHWSIGAMGYFPTYSLGNILSVQLWDRVLDVVPDLEAQIERGDFSALLDWLRENIHRHGQVFTPQDLVQRATGDSLNVAPYAKYLREKFGAVYGL